MKTRINFSRIMTAAAMGFAGVLALPTFAGAAVFTPPEGIFVSSSIITASGGRSIHKEDVTLDFVSGVLVRARWSELETSPGVYDFSLLDAELAQAEKYNTKVTLAILNGPSAPSWLKQEGAGFMDVTDYQDGTQKSLPLPWDAVYLQHWKNFVAALGARYNSHPRIALVHVTHSTGNGLEMQLPEESEVHVPWVDAGYDEDALIGSWKEVIDAFGYAFPDKPLDLEIHPVLRSNRVAREATAYGVSVLGEQFGSFAAWWSPKNAASGYPEMYEILRQTTANSFGAVQFVCSWTSEPERMGEGGIENAVQLALQNGIRYLEVWNEDIRNPVLAPLWQKTALALDTLNEKPVISAMANRSVSEDATAQLINFTVTDAETDASQLLVSVSSSDTALFPASNLVLGGSGSNRTLSVMPAADASGSAQITLIVSDGSQTGSSAFTLTVNSVNDVPTVSTLADISLKEDSSSSTYSFSVNDAETDKASLTVSASADNSTLLPASAFAFGTQGSNRTLKITPAANQAGSTRVTLKVSDGTATTSTSFNVTVTEANDSPVISTLSPVSMNEDGSAISQSFTLSDVETAAGSLVVTASSNSTSLLPTSGITLGGSGGNRTISVKPAANKSGTATVTVTASDGVTSTRSTFTVTVDEINDAPSIATIANFSINEDAASTSKSFAISDAETSSDKLVVKASSSNTTLIPNTNLVLGGTTGSRSIKLTPAANQSGSAVITLTVSDGTLTSTSQFTVTVAAVNDKPTISGLGSLSVATGSTGNAVPFTINDAETAAGSLVVSASSSSTSLVSTSQIVIQGSGSSRSLSITPTAGKTGSATITVKVSDGVASTSTKFTLTIQ